MRISQSKYEGEKSKWKYEGPDQFIHKVCNFDPSPGHFVILTLVVDSPWVDFSTFSNEISEVNLICWTDRDTPDTHKECQESKEIDLDTSRETPEDFPKILEKVDFPGIFPLLDPFFEAWGEFQKIIQKWSSCPHRSQVSLVCLHMFVVYSHSFLGQLHDFRVSYGQFKLRHFPLIKSLIVGLQVFRQSVLDIRAPVNSHIFGSERYLQSLNSEKSFKINRASFDDENQGICCWECLRCFHVVSWSYVSWVFLFRVSKVTPEDHPGRPKFQNFTILSHFSDGGETRTRRLRLSESFPFVIR